MSDTVLEQFTSLQSPRTTVKRLAKRGEYGRETINGIIDEALICHVGFVVNGSPVVIPTIHTRIGETLYFHGSAASRMLWISGAGLAYRIPRRCRCWKRRPSSVLRRNTD